MTKKLVLLAGLALMLPTLALAGTVTYTTTGSFSGGSIPISFKGLTTTIDASPPGTFAPMGTFLLKACPAHQTCSSAGETFTLMISQTAPSGGSNNVTAVLTGTLVRSKSTLVLTFTGGTTINGVVYTPQPVVMLAVGKNTAVQFVISAVPEPSAQLLLGLGSIGLMGMGLISRNAILSR